MPLTICHGHCRTHTREPPLWALTWSPTWPPVPCLNDCYAWPHRVCTKRPRADQHGGSARDYQELLVSLAG